MPEERKLIDREALVERLEPRYPSAARQARGGAHLGMADLSHDTQDAIRAGNWALVQEHFDFVGQIFVEADDYVQNAIYVSYLEHVLLDRTSPLEMKARSLLPPMLARALLGLEAHFKWLGGQRPTNHIYHFISGHLDLTPAEFDEHYKPALDAVLAVRETEGFVVGDAEGADTLAQQYLADKDAVVFVYHLLEAPRYNADFPTKGGFGSDPERHAALTLASDFEITWARPGQEDSSLQQNLGQPKKS